MDPEVANFGVVMIIIVVVVAALAAITVRFIRNIKPQPSKEPPNPLYDQRLDQLQQSVDAIAVEVERIAEAQRFSAKLLAERETPALPR
ncbi:MAG: hypothetical protein ACJ8AF_06515 [Gemmatimonadaceae bacterium]